jgi:hypothetical protein
MGEGEWREGIELEGVEEQEVKCRRPQKLSHLQFKRIF